MPTGNHQELWSLQRQSKFERPAFIHYLWFNSFTQILKIHLNSISPHQNLKSEPISWKKTCYTGNYKIWWEHFFGVFRKSSVFTSGQLQCEFCLEQSLISQINLANALHSVSQILISRRGKKKVFNFYRQTKKRLSSVERMTAFAWWV